MQDTNGDGKFDSTKKTRRRSVLEVSLEFFGFHKDSKEKKSEFLLPKNAARRSLAAFRAKASKHTAPQPCLLPYRATYSTDDASFLRHSFFGSVLSDELLWAQPITYACFSGLLVGEIIQLSTTNKHFNL